MADIESVEISIVVDNARASTVAEALRDLDQRLRQTPVISIEDESAPDVGVDLAVAARESVPRAISPARGGLLVDRASSGSFELVGQLYGQVLAFFISDPVTALTNFVTLVAVARGIWEFFVGSEEEEVRVGDVRELKALVREAARGGRKVDVRLKEQSGLLRGRSKEIRIKIR